MNIKPKDEEEGALIKKEPVAPAQSGISRMGLYVLILLACQNCMKNLVMRAAVQGGPKFMYSAAVIGSEGSKLLLSFAYVLCTGGSPKTVLLYLTLEWRKFALLAVPAAIYNLQQTLEYVALSNLDAAVFSVIVQSKLLTTALFSAVLMGKRLRRAQVLSLVLLTTGVMLAQLQSGGEASAEADGESRFVGICATLGIALSSGFAAVYTEKVIKGSSSSSSTAVNDDASHFAAFGGKHPGLAYTQVQLAFTSLIIEGSWAAIKDGPEIIQMGLFHGVDAAATVSILNSAIGGLTVAAVLKFADAVLKGYATAVSVMLTGLFSMVIFGTTLTAEYYLGMINVMVSIIFYNSTDLVSYAW